VVDLEPLLNGPTRPEEMRPVSRYPSSDIDLAFTVPETVAAGAVEATLRESVEELLEWVRLFDVYRGEAVPGDTRSLAFRLRFQAQDRTLTDEEIAGLRQQAIDAVESTHGAQLRG
jgi:phenylalanyl-tRNA synthetase beta chain